MYRNWLFRLHDYMCLKWGKICLHVQTCKCLLIRLRQKFLFHFLHIRDREEEGETCSWEKGTSSPGERNHFILGLSPFLHLKIPVGIASGESTCLIICPFTHRWEYGYESWAFSLQCSSPPTSFSPRFPHKTVTAGVSCHHYQTRRVPNSKPFNFISFKGQKSPIFPLSLQNLHDRSHFSYM